ncbi:unnamed protein product [Symbiodinium sp. CCMP2592]|nr:unnamed protein product [Symbiodinium sp. CCMP2592]
MGKAGKWGAGWKTKTAKQDAADWGDYRGSGSDYYGRWSKWGQEPSSSAFPTYEMMNIEVPKDNQEALQTIQGPGDLAKFVQKAVNNIRRAEQRARKHAAEQKQTDEKWEQFQKELKTSFMKERARYKDKSEHLQQEKAEIREAQETAIAELYKLLADPQEYTKAPTTKPPPQEAQDEWDKLMAEPDQDADMGLSGLLAGALGDSALRDKARRQMLAVLEHHQNRGRDQTPPKKACQPPAYDSASIGRRAESKGPGLGCGPWCPRSSCGGSGSRPVHGLPLSQQPTPVPELYGSATTIPGYQNSDQGSGQKASNCPGFSCQPGEQAGRKPCCDDGGGGHGNPRWQRGRRQRRGNPHWQLESSHGPAAGDCRRLTQQDQWSVSAELPDHWSDEIQFGPYEDEDEHIKTIGAHGLCERLFRSVLSGPNACQLRPPIWRSLSPWDPRTFALVGPLDLHRVFPPRDDVGPQAQRWWSILEVHFALIDWLWRSMGTALPFLGSMGRAVALPFFFILAVAEMMVLLAQIRWSRPFATTRRGGYTPTPSWPRLLLPFALCAVRASAGLPHQPRQEFWPLLRMPPPTDVELWMAGQNTVSEQLALALQRVILERPLMSQGLWPEHLHGTGPSHVPEPPPPREIVQEEPAPWLFDDEEEDTTHISFRLLSPHFESESLDIAMTFPLVAEDVLDYLKDTARVITRRWLTGAVFTQPQLSEDYGSVIITPCWLRESDQTIMVIDASAIDQGQFAFYHRGDLTREAVLQQLDIVPAQDVEIYAFGSTAPMRTTEPIPSTLGGLIRILPQEQPIQWASRIEARLNFPMNWDPDAPHPDHLGGSHIAFQTATDQKLHNVRRDDLFTPLGVASELFNREQQQIWDCFFPGDVIEALDITFCPGFSLVVTGGRKGRSPGLLYIRDGDLLEAFLRPTADLTPTQVEEDESSDGNDEGEDPDDGTDSTRDMLPSSDEFSDAQPPTGPGPFGPPPPRPVNRPPSRTPPRRNRHKHNLVRTIALQEYLSDPSPAEHYSLSMQTVTLPQAKFDPLVVYRPWPPHWLQFDPTALNLPQCTVQALQGFWPWTTVLKQGADQENLCLRLYTDGSWLEASSCGGFAIILVLESGQHSSFFGAVGSQTQGKPDSLWNHPGPPALRNEQYALASAMLWVFQSLPFLAFKAVTFCFDCLAAGLAASGAWTPDGALMQRIRDLQVWLEQVAGATIAFEHVKAHSGHPMNEMANQAAKAAARGQLQAYEPPFEVVQLIMQEDLSWIAPSLNPSQQDAIPFARGGTLQWEPDMPFKPFQLEVEHLVPTFTKQVGRQSSSMTQVECVAISLNVQGLRDKHRYLEDQFDMENCNLVFLQETKSPMGVCASQAYLRLGTDHQKHWGVGIWVSRTRGLFMSEGSPIHITEQDVYVVQESPRLLVLEITTAGIRFVLFAGHCPHTGQRAAAAQFITDLHDALYPLRGAHVILGGLDLNGRPPSDFEQVTGNLQHGDPDDTGREAVEAFHDLGLWIPSTFSCFHKGDSFTYRHPQGQLHRLDFVVQGGKLEVCQAASAVLYDLDTGGASDDHWAVRAHFQGTLPQTGAQTKIWRPQYDRVKLLSEAGRKIVAEAMQAYQPPSWNTNPDEHCCHFTSYVQALLEKHFMKQPHAPRADYITEQTWQLRRAKLSLKRKTRHRSNLWSSLLVRAFMQWREGIDVGVTQLIVTHGLLYQLASTAIGVATAAIKKGIRKAKDGYLRNVASQGGPRPTDILCHLKRAGLGGAKTRPTQRQLPLLLDADGQPVKTKKDRDLLWLKHFGKQEMGQIEEVHAFLQREHQPVCIDQDLTWRADDLPSLGEIEAVIRMAPKGKAAGLDGIPSEALRAAPGPMAAALQSLFTKASLRLRQPLQWRGGLLYECWKQSGRRCDPTSHRSLFVSSVVGKCLHKLTRRKIQSFVNEGLHEFHLGARRGQPVLYPAAYILSFLRRAQAQHRSVGVLFLDAEAAYYRICRDLATGTIETDEAVIAIFKRFHIPPTDLHMLMQEVLEGGMMADIGVPATIRHMAKDLHANTWFISPHGDGTLLSRTCAGSRPGESWADAIFSFVFGRVLARITEIARGEDLLDTLHADMAEGPFATAEGDEEACASDATWADDSSWAITDASPVRLMAKATRLCSVVLGQCQSYGLAPNLKPGKTAILIRLQGQGAKHAQRQHFGHGRRSVRLADVAVEVEVTNHYKHLGGVVETKGYGGCEARRRLAIAATAFDKGKDLLYQNTTIPLATRSSLMHIAVTATLHNLALWIPEGSQWEKLCQGYARLARRLLMKEINPGDLLHIPPVFAIVATDSPPLDLLATKARLSFMASMAKAAPVALWAALQAEGSWLGALRKDMAWLRDGDEDQWPNIGPAYWPAWRRMLCEAKPWFKRQVAKKVAKASIAYYKKQKMALTLWALYRRAVEYLPTEGTPTTQHVCRPCSRTFKTKGALGAHFQKTHSRCAKYRAVVEGSICKSCGVQFWTEGRLARHLRDTPQCVATLRACGYTAKVIVPGTGSRARRKAELDGYHPAPPTQLCEPAEAGASSDWDQTQKEAHAKLCDVLLVENPAADQAEALEIIRGNIALFPLYFDEAREVVGKILEEIDSVANDLLDDYWTPSALRDIRQAAETFLADDWPIGDECEGPRKPPATFEALNGEVEKLKWTDVVRRIRSLHGTRRTSAWTLPSDWEAEWWKCSAVVSSSAVKERLWCWVPVALQQAWDHFLNGGEVTLLCPDSFWNSPLAEPFLSFRSLHTN